MQAQITASDTLLKNLGLIKRQQYLEALDRYKTYLNQSPDHLALILIDLYKQLSSNIKNLPLKLVIVELYIKFSFYTEACEELEDMYSIDPNYSQTFFLIAKIYNKINNIDFTLSIFEDAFQNGCRDSIIIDLLPKIYLDHNMVEKGITFFEAFLASETSYPHYNKILAELYRTAGNPQQGVTIYKDLIENHPDYIKDACHYTESVLSRFPFEHDIRKLCIEFCIKDCNPQQASVHLTKLTELNSRCDVKDTSALYHSVLDIFPSHENCLKSYINFLQYKKCYTDLLGPLGTLFKEYNQHSNFIDEIVSAVIEEDPKHIGMQLFLIDCHFYKKDYEKGLLCVRSLIESATPELLDELKSKCLAQWNMIGQHKSDLCFCIATILFTQEKYIDSLNYCNQISPITLEPLTLKIKILNEQDNITEAFSCLQTHIQNYFFEKPLHDLYRELSVKQTLNQKAQTSFNKFDDIYCHLLLNKPLQAIELAQQVTFDDPDYGVAQLLLIRSFIEKGKFDHALQLLHSIIPFLKEGQSSNLVPALFFNAMCYYFTAQFESAFKVLNEIEQIDISFPFCAPLKGWLQRIPFSFNRGLCVTGLIDLPTQSIIPAAIQNTYENTCLTKKINTMSFGVNHNNQGIQYLLQDNRVSAESEFNLCMQLDPALSTGYCNFGLNCILNDNASEAETAIQKALELTPDLDVAYVNYGLYYYQQGLHDDALDSFQKALKINPHNLHAHFNLAIIYYLKNRLVLCFQYLKKLNQYGFFFIPVQRAFHYLESSCFNTDYWLSPKSRYAFDTVNH